MRALIQGVVLGCIATSSYAAVSLGDHLSVSGFGSFSVAKSDNSTPLLVNREITDETCWDCDTTVGLQVDLRLTDQLRASAQLVKRPHDHFSSPELEWAYIDYEGDEWGINAGRLRLPLFLTSEYYYVGHAYTWARPPTEVYGSTIGFTSYEGASAHIDIELPNEGILKIGPYVGIPREDDISLGRIDIHFDIDRLLGFTAELSHFNYTLRTAMLHSKYSTSFNPEPAIINVYTLGGQYFWQDWEWMAEVQSDTLQTNWYVSGAYQWGDIKPYLVYGESHHRSKSKSVTLGVRYDLRYNISINAEWQQFMMRDSDYMAGNSGQFVEPPILHREDKDAQLLTLMVNFVF
ncbi:hypothetical protein [Thaumasiovibrio sp. DFM-14]|uniref:hypothetical protein n=1 Tax=Thaumasiovibrio sp. DFM-14 TaxID=3384792 RepID=UPI0039A1C36E